MNEFALLALTVVLLLVSAAWRYPWLPAGPGGWRVVLVIGSCLGLGVAAALNYALPSEPRWEP